MSFPMHLNRKASGSNQRMSQELAPLRAAEAIRAIGVAAEALHALSKTASPSPGQILSAVLTWRAGLAEIARLERELLGCAVLGGQSVSTTAAKLSVRPQTLSSWIAGTSAQWRGQEMKRVEKGKWKPLHPADQQVSGSEAGIGAGDDARSMPNAGPSGSEDAAGTGRKTAGTGADAAGDDVDPEVLAAALADVERDLLGGGAR
ncbi:hypothetical protein [Tsukamurella tyrosinosolvens]|uniref:hypothetical protein n=1 Tax=Tsukamurella tyrosinosolvens TaxID=57704 RepID=UPI002DD45076|nr:hypothetical protein [Tsukamurella tyrosinosolvens]MEC4615507.1 hypothetical protein [Tsukamurella tyrosinosolvens]